MADTSITNGDLQELLRSNPMAAQQLEAIAARRERDEALAQLAEIKACTCEDVEQQLPLVLS